MHNGASHNGHGALTTPKAVEDDLLDKGTLRGSTFRIAVIVFAALSVLGVVGFVIRLTDGIGNTPVWGYHAALFAFILTAAQGAPMVAIAPRIANAHWRRSISRVAELFGLVGVVSFIIYIPIAWVLPSMEDGRRTLWFYGKLHLPAHMPEITVTLVLLALTVTGLWLLWVSAMPDLAMLRDRSTGTKKLWYGRLARGWVGTSGQWHWQKHRLGYLGAFYFMMLVTAHFAFSIDFAVALVPGWVDALYPATHAHNSLQAGVAITLIAMFVMYRFGGYKDYITSTSSGDWVSSCSPCRCCGSGSGSRVSSSSGSARSRPKRRCSTFCSSGLTCRYSSSYSCSRFRSPVVDDRNPLRKSVWGPVVIACGVLIATLFDRIRVYVSAFSVSESTDMHQLVEIPDAVLPGLPTCSSGWAVSPPVFSSTCWGRASSRRSTYGNRRNYCCTASTSRSTGQSAGAGQAGVVPPNAEPCKNTFS